MPRNIAPGPDRTPEPRTTTGQPSPYSERTKAILNAKYGKPHRQPFFTKGSYFALGWLASAGLLAWTGHLDIAVYWYAVGGILFVIFCGPMVQLILKKLDDFMIADHERNPAVHGAWFKSFCPTCHALYTE